MSLQSFGPKKVARLSAQTGLALEAVFNRSGPARHVEARTVDDEHYWIDRETFALDRIEDPVPISSCARRHYGTSRNADMPTLVLDQILAERAAVASRALEFFGGNAEEAARVAEEYRSAGREASSA